LRVVRKTWERKTWIEWKMEEYLERMRVLVCVLMTGFNIDCLERLRVDELISIMGKK